MTVQELIKHFEDIVMVEPGTVDMDTVLDDLDDWDSLSMAALLTMFEEKLDLKLENTALRNLEKFSDIVNLVKDKLEM